ncbi:DUF3108 domain-containing protein [Telluribacter humicola]|uniref:DUF3108 domain-containing protein n=1 Tax=Telluribacter humicola TaxID=1720261 RepID=UPI001A95C675|nr:DUF3108 domain-containing protein [Telluribacter humicola]
MNKLKIIVLLTIVSLATVAFAPFNGHKAVQNESFIKGERIDYRVHYGFINAAEAKVEVARSVVSVNNRPCYRVNVTGKTVGAFDMITRVRDQWRSYIDTSAILPHMFYRNIQENNYRKEETVVFNHNSNTAFDKDQQKSYKVPNNIHDIISGYFFLRTLDFSRIGVGEVVEVPTFFDGEVYKLRIRYGGKSEVKTKFGKIKVLKLVPFIPDNKLFKGENPMTLWVSDDDNKIPVKAEVELVIGSLDMDIKSYKGLKMEPNWM